MPAGCRQPAGKICIMRIVVLSLIAVLWLAAAHAQKLTLSGHVYTSDTARLDGAGASIQLPGQKTGAVADAHGDFRIVGLSPGRTRVTVSLEGYKSLDTVINISRDRTLNFLLAGDVKELESVIISGAVVRRDQITTAIKTILAGADLERTRGLSLGESLKGITGVNSLQMGPGVSKPVIHGVYSNRVLVMNNGVRQEGQNWGNDHAPEIDPFIASKVTVVKGAASIRYGSDAIGGVILLDPKDLPNSPGVDGELNLVGMTNGRLGAVSGYAEGASGGKLDGLSWRVQGTLKDAGNFQTPRYYLGNTGLSENDFSATLGYNKTHYGVSVYYSQFDTKLGIASASVVDSYSDFISATTLLQPAVRAGFTYSIGRPYQTVTHQLAKASGYLDLGNAGRLEAVYAYQHDLRKEFDANPSDNSDTSLNTDAIPDYVFQLNTYTLDLIWELPTLFHALQGSVGINYISHGNIQAHTSYQALIPNFRDEGGGAFAIEKYAVKKWVFEAGLRYDYRWLQAFKLNPTDPRIEEKPTYSWDDPTFTVGATYQFNSHLVADYNFGSAWRAPQAIELFANGIHQAAAAWELGDSALTLERAYNNNLAFTYTSKRFRVEAGGYVNYFHHYIYAKPEIAVIKNAQGQTELVPTLTPSSDGYYPTYQYTQVNALFSGLDLEVTYDFIRHFSLISKASIVRARNLDSNAWLINIPADRFDNTIRYTLPTLGKWKQFFIGLNNLVVSKQSRFPVGGDYVAPPGGYMLWGADAGISIPFYAKTIDLSLSVSNLTNVAYRDYLNQYRFYVDDLGRNVSLRLRVPLDFKKQ